MVGTAQTRLCPPCESSRESSPVQSPPRCPWLRPLPCGRGHHRRLPNTRLGEGLVRLSSTFNEESTPHPAASRRCSHRPKAATLSHKGERVKLARSHNNYD